MAELLGPGADTSRGDPKRAGSDPLAPVLKQASLRLQEKGDVTVMVLSPAERHESLAICSVWRILRSFHGQAVTGACLSLAFSS